MSHSTAQIFHLMFVGWWETNLPLNSSPLVIHTQIRRRSHCLCSGFKDYGYNINKEKSWYLHWTMYSISPIFPLLHYRAILGEGKWGKKKKRHVHHQMHTALVLCGQRCSNGQGTWRTGYPRDSIS